MWMSSAELSELAINAHGVIYKPVPVKISCWRPRLLGATPSRISGYARHSAP